MPGAESHFAGKFVQRNALAVPRCNVSTGVLDQGYLGVAGGWYHAETSNTLNQACVLRCRGTVSLSEVCALRRELLFVRISLESEHFLSFSMKFLFARRGCESNDKPIDRFRKRECGGEILPDGKKSVIIT
jgi:hypothetical protein